MRAQGSDSRARRPLAIRVPIAAWLRCHRQWALPVISVLTLTPATSAKLYKLHRTTLHAAQLLIWLVRLWNIEVTLEEVRTHLGLAIKGQGSTLAVARTTSCLLGLFSLVVLMVQSEHPDHLPARHSGCYPKAEPTFVDALAHKKAKVEEMILLANCFSTRVFSAYRCSCCAQRSNSPTIF